MTMTFLIVLCVYTGPGVSSAIAANRISSLIHVEGTSTTEVAEVWLSLWSSRIVAKEPTQLAATWGTSSTMALAVPMATAHGTWGCYAGTARGTPGDYFRVKVR